MSSGEWVRVGDPASRSWSPVRLSGACGPAAALSAAVRKDLNLNLSAVHEKIRSRAYGQRFRNWFREKASGSIRAMRGYTASRALAMRAASPEPRRIPAAPRRIEALQTIPGASFPRSVDGALKRSPPNCPTSAKRRASALPIEIRGMSRKRPRMARRLRTGEGRGAGHEGPNSPSPL
jgi:hypothetical protein